MSAVAGVLAMLPKQWQGLVLLLVAVSTGVAGGLYLSGFTNLPAKVSVNSSDIVSNSSHISVNSSEIAENSLDIAELEAAGLAQYKRIICLLTLPDSVIPIQTEGRCK